MYKMSLLLLMAIGKNTVVMCQNTVGYSGQRRQRLSKALHISEYFGGSPYEFVGTVACSKSQDKLSNTLHPISSYLVFVNSATHFKRIEQEQSISAIYTPEYYFSMSFEADQQIDPSVVATLNNTAANEMLRGNHVKAVRMLSTALKQTSRFLRLCKAQSNDEGGPPPDEGHDERHQVFCSFLSPKDSSPQRGEIEEDECFLFSSPLQIDCESAVRSATPRVVAETFSHAIVYNLALCHHLMAMATPEICKRMNHLRRAAALYDQAKRLLVKESQPIHRIVVFNNLGHANHVLGSDEVSRKYFRKVLIIITSETSTTSEQHSSSSFMLRLDGFLRNALLLVLGSSTTVAAAA
jgi:hypothetical protein